MTTKRTYIDFDQELPKGEEWFTTKAAVEFIKEQCPGLAHYVSTVAKLHNLLCRDWRDLNIVYRRSERGLGGNCRLFVSKQSVLENESRWQHQMRMLEKQIEDMTSGLYASY